MTGVVIAITDEGVLRVNRRGKVRLTTSIAVRRRAEFGASNIAKLRPMLFRAQRGICALCGQPGELKCSGKKRTWPSTDHVMPLEVCEIAGLGNQVYAHLGCNNDKGNRMPTGCELIWLLAVNARLGAQPQQW